MINEVYVCLEILILICAEVIYLAFLENAETMQNEICVNKIWRCSGK